jgi:hypothetical protein
MTIADPEAEGEALLSTYLKTKWAYASTCNWANRMAWLTAERDLGRWVREHGPAECREHIARLGPDGKLSVRPIHLTRKEA